jgi:hypothetical protein
VTRFLTLTVAEAVELTGRSEKRIRRMIAEGLRTVPGEGDTLIATAHLRAFIEGEDVAA